MSQDTFRPFSDYLEKEQALSVLQQAVAGADDGADHAALGGGAVGDARQVGLHRARALADAREARGFEEHRRGRVSLRRRARPRGRARGHP